MPYIRPEDRKKFDYVLNSLPNMSTKGELEYCIFKLMLMYFKDGKAWRYLNLHDATYAASHCSDEFRRRFLDVREEQAIYQNGDITY